MNVLKKTLSLISAIVFALAHYQCKREPKRESVMEKTRQDHQSTAHIQKSDYGKTKEGESVILYNLRNAHGMEVDIITYGGRITSLKVPDKNGAFKNVVLGFDSLESYLAPNPYHGALIGRYSNRIANASFSLDGKKYPLAKNNGENHLHGGIHGFDKVIWQASEETGVDFARLRLTYRSIHMEEGYPGNLDIQVTYTLTAENQLEVLYEATTDKKTIVNLTQHAYFNLSGDFEKQILDHELQLHADYFLPVNDELIPIGEPAPVKGTPLDFTVPKTIGRDIEMEDEQMKTGKGYDHCWVLNRQDQGFRKIAKVSHPHSGRIMEVFSTEPGVQFYSGNFLKGMASEPGGGPYSYRTGLCLETQHFPDSPNRADFPSTVLAPGEKYVSKTAFQFSLEK
ncbi:MAG: aldose epimerase family protein [Bacteroidota bacterium]